MTKVKTPLVHFSILGEWEGRGGRLLPFPNFRVGAYSRWVLIQSWAFNLINTVCTCIFVRQQKF